MAKPDEMSFTRRAAFLLPQNLCAHHQQFRAPALDVCGGLSVVSIAISTPEIPKRFVVEMAVDVNYLVLKCEGQCPGEAKLIAEAH